MILEFKHSDCRLLCAALSLGLIAAVSTPGCQQTDDQMETAEGRLIVTLALNWYAEAEHGGYVYAAEHGLDEKAGIKISLQQGGPTAGNTVLRELATGRVPFAISNADLVITARASGLPLVAIAAPLQQSPRCIMVHEASGITSLAELKDVELAVNDTRPFAKWIKTKVPLTGVTQVPFSGGVREFLMKPNFAQQAYVFSEPFSAKEAGASPRSLMLSDIGFNPYGSVLVTTEEMIREQPDVVRAMVTASVAGWEAYLDDPESTNAAIHRDNPEMSLGSLNYGSNAMKALCEPPTEHGICGMLEDRWEMLIDQLEEIEEIKEGAVVASECFDLQFFVP